jgi:hypothetical protein
MTDFARLILDADTRGLKQGERDLESLQRQSAQTARQVDSSASTMGGAFKRVGVALAAAGIGSVLFDFGKRSAQAAIDAQEMGSAFEVVFGGMASDVAAWAEETGNALGRSTQEIQRGALAFQELFGKALNPEQSAELSKQFTLLTQDLASFKNLSNEVAQQKLFSGLVGEAEPLRAVGVFLSENALQARAAAMGLGDFSKELTDQEKIVVRAAEIQAQLAMATGDVERTGGSAANQIKTMNAAVEELQVAIGSKLLPQLTPLISGTAQIITVMANAAQSFTGLGVSLSTLGRILITVGSGWAAYRLTLLAASAATTAMSSTLAFNASVVMATARSVGVAQAAQVAMTGATTAATGAFRAFTAAMIANPFTAVAVAVGVLATSFVGLANAQAQARAETDNLIRSLDAAIKARGADVASKRAEADVERMRTQGRLDEINAEQRRLRGPRGLGSGNRAMEIEAQELTWKLVQLEGTVRLADRTLADMEKTAGNVAVPVTQAATAVTGLKKELDGVGASSKVASNEFQKLYDRLFPFQAASKKFAEEMALIQKSRLSDAEKEAAIARLEGEAFDNRTRNLGKATVSKGLTGQGSLMVLPENTNLTTQQISAQTEAERIIKQTGDYKSALKVLQDASAKTTASVTENFTQMADRTLQALDRMVGAIRGGGFLNILSGVLNFGLQLAGIGVFGKAAQQQLQARADGGQVNAGRTYLVGERGPELFSPASHGSITPNSKLQGGGMVINVDARGSTDPEAVRQQVQRGILEAAPSIVAAAEQRTIATLRRPRLAGAM